MNEKRKKMHLKKFSRISLDKTTIYLDLLHFIYYFLATECWLLNRPFHTDKYQEDTFLLYHSKALNIMIGEILDLKTDSGSFFHLKPLRFSKYGPPQSSKPHRKPQF